MSGRLQCNSLFVGLGGVRGSERKVWPSVGYLIHLPSDCLHGFMVVAITPLDTGIYNIDNYFILLNLLYLTLSKYIPKSISVYLLLHRNIIGCNNRHQ